MLDSPALAERPATIRSRVTNGRKLTAGLDGRSAEASRYRDLCQTLAHDHPGASVLNAGQTALVRQATAMIVASERMQAPRHEGRACRR